MAGLNTLFAGALRAIYYQGADGANLSKLYA
jgi:hypothetical protein